MGFLDKARAAANDLAAKADTALAGSGLGGPGVSAGGDADKLFRDLGILAYLEEGGREVPPGERARVMASLQQLDSRGGIRSFALQTTPPPGPGQGGAASPPPPPGAAAAASGAGAGAPPVPSSPPGGPTAPPPPPSWMQSGGS